MNRLVERCRSADRRHALTRGEVERASLGNSIGAMEKIIGSYGWSVIAKSRLRPSASRSAYIVHVRFKWERDLQWDRLRKTLIAAKLGRT